MSELHRRDDPLIRKTGTHARAEREEQRLTHEAASRAVAHLSRTGRGCVVDHGDPATCRLAEELRAVAADKFFVEIGRGPNRRALDHAREADAHRAFPLKMLRHRLDRAGHFFGRERIGRIDTKPLRKQFARRGVHDRAFECRTADIDAESFHGISKSKKTYDPPRSTDKPSRCAMHRLHRAGPRPHRALAASVPIRAMRVTVTELRFGRGAHR